MTYLPTFVYEQEGSRFRVSPEGEGLRVDRWCDGDAHHQAHWDRLPGVLPDARSAVEQARRNVA